MASASHLKDAEQAESNDQLKCRNAQDASA